MENLYKYDNEKLEFISIRRRQFFERFLLTGFVIFTFIAISSFTPTNIKVIEEPTENSLIILDGSREFSPEALKAALENLNVKYPDIVYAQAVQETGSFRSAIFIENNNLFGMKAAKVRATTNRGTNRGHAIYDSWYESVLDYALYQSRYLGRLNRDQYFQYLRQNYAEDPNYVNRLKAIIKRQK